MPFCHALCIYANLGQENRFLKGHLWLPAQRYEPWGEKKGEPSYRLADAQMYRKMAKHSFRQFGYSEVADG